MNITNNPASLAAAADINEIAVVLRQTTEALTTASTLLTNLFVSHHDAIPAISAATVVMVDAMDEAIGAIDAGRKSLLDTADGLAFGEGEVTQ